MTSEWVPKTNKSGDGRTAFSMGNDVHLNPPILPPRFYSKPTPKTVKELQLVIRFKPITNCSSFTDGQKSEPKMRQW